MAGAVTSEGAEPGVLSAIEGETLVRAKGDDPASPGAMAATEPLAKALRKNLSLERVVVIKFLQKPSKWLKCDSLQHCFFDAQISFSKLGKTPLSRFVQVKREMPTSQPSTLQ